MNTETQDEREAEDAPPQAEEEEESEELRCTLCGLRACWTGDKQ